MNIVHQYHAAEHVFPLRTHSDADNLYKSKLVWWTGMYYLSLATTRPESVQILFSDHETLMAASRGTVFAVFC